MRPRIPNKKVFIDESGEVLTTDINGIVILSEVVEI